MSAIRFHSADLVAVAIAALGTLALGHLHLTATTTDAELRSSELPTSEAALEGLIEAESAAREGAWLLDEPDTTVELSYAAQHDRLVWRVSGGQRSVLLDARTGDALEFEFG